MWRLVNQRVLITVVVAGLVLIGGCASGGGSGNATSTNTDVPTTESSDLTTTASRTTDDPGTTPDAATTDQYTFSQGETYTYTIVNQDREFVWQVTDVSNGDITVEIRGDSVDGETRSVTFNGTQTDAGNTLFTNTSKVFPLFGSLHNAVTITNSQSLEVGNSWTVTHDSLPRLFGFDWETASAEVTGTGSHNGITYHNVTITPESEPHISATFTVNQDYPFALSWSSSGTATAIDTGVLIIQSIDR